MKRVLSFIAVVVVVLLVAGAAFAAEMSGKVTAVDAAKGTITLKSGSADVGFDCETGSLVKDVKVGDDVTVEYKEVGGKKKATKVTSMKKKTGGY